MFKDLWVESPFADVTLVSDDQIQTMAHKVVLSACSPVLKTLLVNNPHSHPLLYLRGIKQTELQALMKFMYFGETQIFQKGIKEFMNKAKELKIKVTEGQESDGCGNSAEESKAEKNFKTEQCETKPTQEELAGNDERFSCDECDAVFSYLGVLSRHKQSKHDSLLNIDAASFSCADCSSIFSSKGNLNKHTKSKHECLTYQCDECNAVFTQINTLDRHKLKHIGIRTNKPAELT